MSLKDFNLIAESRSALISTEYNLNSLALHFKLRRHESSFVPNIVSVSDAHFIKLLPPFSVMQLRNPVSHAVCAAVAEPVDVGTESSALRWARTWAANSSLDTSEPDSIARSKIALK